MSSTADDTTSPAVLDQLRHYQGAGKPNPVVVPLPAHEILRIPGVGQFVPVPIPPATPAWVIREMGGVENWRKWCGPRQLLVGASSDDTKHGRLLHVSVSRPTRLPAWEDMAAIRDYFFGQQVDAAMILPRRTDWVNFHETCFHLWQIPVEWGIR